MSCAIVQEHLCGLSHVFVLDVARDYSRFVARGFKNPPGYNFPVIDVLVHLPPRYPVQPPGVPPSTVYLPEGLRYRGRTPADYHTWGSPRGWAWWCFRRIDWDPCQDNLITFMELLRATMTDPCTK